MLFAQIVCKPFDERERCKPSMPAREAFPALPSFVRM